MTGVINNVQAILFWMHFIQVFFIQTPQERWEWIFSGMGVRAGGQGEWLQLQRQTEPGTQYTIAGHGSLSKDENETNGMKLEGSTNRFL